jgi:sugar phosphate isomerase/epimerase
MTSSGGFNGQENSTGETMKLGGHDIGVCSWSLHPKDTADLIALMKQVGLSHLQLYIGPLIKLDEAAQKKQIDEIKNAGITITAGMMGFPGEDYSTIARIKQTGGFVPDELWDERRELFGKAVAICKRFGIGLLSTHIGFVPPSSDSLYASTVQRINDICALLDKEGMGLLMETGQEPASELLQFLNDLRCRNVYVNFDPANMILYGAGDPIEAIRILGRHIRHVHVKDATASDQPGTKWGAEVPFGTGQVPPMEFVDALKEVGYRGPLVIEREAGENRVKDVKGAVEVLGKVLG